MEGQISIYGYGSYKEYREELRKELTGQASSFVRTGYLLRLAQDTDILEESGYGDVLEFAFREFGLDRSQVSRYININREYSEGGYSDRLQEVYRDYGYAKLALMLTLPEAVREELTPEYTKTEIQAVKEEIEAERQVSDIELLMEKTEFQPEKPGQSEKEDSILKKVLDQLMRENPGVFRDIYETMDSTVPGPEMENALAEVLAPMGSGMYSVRIPGEGRWMMSVRGKDEPVTLVNVRHPEEKEKCTWEDMENALWELLETDMDHETMEKTWERRYGEPYPQAEEPEKTGIAPVQQTENKDGKKKKEKKKNSRVVKASVPPREEPQKPENTGTEEQIPGQDNIMNHPEYLPQGETENITGKAEIAEEIPEDKNPCPENGLAAAGLEPENPENPGTDSPGEETASLYPEEDEEKEIWMEVRASGRMLEEYLHRWKGKEGLMEDDVLEKIHRHAITLAAGLEKIGIIRRRKNGEEHPA